MGGWESVAGTPGRFLAQDEDGVWCFTDAQSEQDGVFHRSGGVTSVDDSFDNEDSVVLGALETTDITSLVDASSVPRALLPWRGVSGVPQFAIGTNTSIQQFAQGVMTDITPADLTAGDADTAPDVGPYGDGAYGVFNYGEGDPLQGGLVDCALWALDNFGTYLVGVLTSDGRLLYWDGISATMQEMGAHAVGTLTIGASVPTAADTVTIGSHVYTWRDTVGTTADEVLIGATIADCSTNLKLAINAGPTGSGTLWGSDTVANTQVTATATTTTVVVTAIAPGDGGNAIATTESGTNTEWNDATLLGGDSAPVNNVAVVVTPERFIVALGAGGDDRLVQWLDRESLTVVTTDEANSAGSLTLSGSGRIMAGRRGRSETLIWTDADLFAMRYIGGDLVYQIEQVGWKCGTISRNAMAGIGGSKFVWMDRREFFVYDGYVQPLPCDVSDYVFSDFNFTQRAKVFAVPVTAFNEVFWFYPSASSQEPNRYVSWNYLNNLWAFGKIERTAGTDSDVFEYPILADRFAAVYEHERGSTRAGADAPYLESGPLELGQGDEIQSITALVPDGSTVDGQDPDSVQAYLKTALYPTSAEESNGPYTLTEKTDVRVTTRQVRLRVEEVTPGDWRFGVVRLEVDADGAR